MTGPGHCWYRDPEHRPAVGGCPRACSGPVSFSERAANGDKLVYCEVHASWRRRALRVPLVRRMRPGEQAEPSPPPHPNATLTLTSSA